MKRNIRKWKLVFIPLLVAAFISLVSLVVMQLWNHLLPGIIHVPVITFWQAMGIFVLCKILFGFGGGPGRGGMWMKGKMQERFSNMDPGQREKFRAAMEERMCGWRKRSRGNEYQEKEVNVDNGN